MKEFSNFNNDSNVFEDIKRRVDIVDIINHYIPLKQNGRNFGGLCPFHDDKNAGNFSVSKEKQIFKCFACGKTGNAISFIEYYEHCSALDAARKVCDIAGINEPRLDKFKTSKLVVDPKIEKTLLILKEINDYYSISLFQSEEGKEALAYLHNRGLDDETILKFDIGYSLKNGKTLIDYLTKTKGFSLKEINETGIIDLNNDKGEIVDKNHGRISFAIKNTEGKICGFSCRVFGNNHSDFKYVNTSSTIVFNKSEILYNYFNASLEASKVGYIYVLEGFMDVIACYRAGIKSAVGLMGTSLTDQHLNLFKRLGNNIEVRFCLDLDNPGQNAMYKNFDRFEKNKIKYRLVNNYVNFIYKDSDEIITNLGKEGLLNFLNNLIDKPNWIINFFKKNYDLSLIENKERLINYFIPILNNNSNLIEVDLYIKLLEKETGVSFDTIKNMMASKKENNYIENNIKEPIKIEKKQPINIDNGLKKAEKLMIKFILQNNEALALFKERLDWFNTPKYEEIYELILNYCLKNKGPYPISKEELIKILNESNKTNLSDEINDIYSYRKFDSYSFELFDELCEKIRSENEKINLKKVNDELIENLNEDIDDKSILSIISESKSKYILNKESKGDKNGKKSRKN